MTVFIYVLCYAFILILKGLHMVLFIWFLMCDNVWTVSKMQHIKDDVITTKSLKGTTLLKCLFRRMGCYFVLINSVGILQTSVKFLTG